MKLLEKNLINTHYYLKPNRPLNLSHIPHDTISPSLIKILIHGVHETYITPDKKFLMKIDFKEHINEFEKICCYVLLDDIDMLNIHQDQWLDKYWNKPFLVSNPIYKYNDKFYLFGNSSVKSCEVINPHNILEDILHNGAYSIGNGIIIGLSLIHLKIWKERNFLIKLDQQTEGLKVYYNIHTFWTTYFQHNPYQLCDNLFKYAFVYNSNHCYQYIYKITYEDMIIYHMPQRCVTSIFNLVTTKEQLKFAYYFIYQYRHAYISQVVLSIVPNIWHHSKFKDFKIVYKIIQLTNMDLRKCIYIITTLYNKTKNKHYLNLWRFLIRKFKDTWMESIYKYLTITGNIPKISQKFIRDSIYLTDFKYTEKWKHLFRQHDEKWKTHYDKIFNRKIIQKLKYLNYITHDYPCGNVVEDLIKNYYREHIEDLIM